MSINQWTFWGWCVRGLEGAVNMAEQTANEDAKLTPEQFAKLKECAERLIAVADKAEGKVEHQ